MTLCIQHSTVQTCATEDDGGFLVIFSLLARNLGECLMIHSPPALFFPKSGA